MVDGVAIEPARPNDLAAALRLMRLLAEEHVDLDDCFEPADDWAESLETMLIERLGRHDHYVGVARCEGRVVGLVTAFLRDAPAFAVSPRGMIENLVVAPELRRKGIGKALVAAATAWCQGRGAELAQAMVAVGNQAAWEFWRRCGYEPAMVLLHRWVGEDRAMNDDSDDREDELGTEDETMLLRRALGADAARRMRDRLRSKAVVEVYDVNGDLLEIVPVPPEGLSIGRAPDQDIVLQDRTVSRRHARIELEDGGRCVVDDAGSLNDTLLDGELVRGRAELHDGAQLTIGLHVLVITIR